MTIYLQAVDYNLWEVVVGIHMYQKGLLMAILLETFKYWDKI